MLRLIKQVIQNRNAVTRFPSKQMKTFFHSTAISSDAFNYMKTYNNAMPEELKNYAVSDIEFTKKINEEAMKLLSTARCSKTIRDAYKSKEMDNAIENTVSMHAENTHSHPDELRNIARIVIKWAARDRMNQLKLFDELDAIHKDNLEKYGNPIGPTPSYLLNKYHGNKKEVAEGAKRFRSDEDLSNSLKCKL